ncbi:MULTISPECIES: c-type cytochrome [unclassified Thioalkalivibrio]|uniref:c-type cytochrome n=1 Tax=unclassified Thioalkalivibrio TaxID=2621013 RepID=UPI000370C84B|nr:MULTISPECIES: c-type cytochrome [unclassified Thioalkalivibrio]
MKAHIYLAGLAASLLMTAAVSGTALADNDEVTRGQLMAASCKACHNAAGAEEGVPDLARLSPELIANQMRAFRDGDRDATIMDRHAKGYTDEEIDAMASYFARF